MFLNNAKFRSIVNIDNQTLRLTMKIVNYYFLIIIIINVYCKRKHLWYFLNSGTYVELILINFQQIKIISYELQYFSLYRLREKLS